MNKRIINWVFRTSLILLILGQLFSISNVSAEGRKTKLDFEDELVEGVSKKPYDSLSQISDRNKDADKAHLYLKRTEFVKETKETLAELQYLQ